MQDEHRLAKDGILIIKGCALQHHFPIWAMAFTADTCLGMLSIVIKIEVFCFALRYTAPQEMTWPGCLIGP